MVGSQAQYFLQMLLQFANSILKQDVSRQKSCFVCLFVFKLLQLSKILRVSPIQVLWQVLEIPKYLEFILAREDLMVHPSVQMYQ